MWASLFALLYRKFFWDFIGGTLRDPGGLQCVVLKQKKKYGTILNDFSRAPPSAAIFVALIVKAPIIPIISMVLGMVLLAIELPLPALKKMAIRRNFVARVVLLLFQVFLNILYYQVCCY